MTAKRLTITLTPAEATALRAAIDTAIGEYVTSDGYNDPDSPDERAWLHKAVKSLRAIDAKLERATP